MSRFVIDASAVLAILQGEAGARTAAELAREALFSTVNFAEVLAKASDRGIEVDATVALIADLGLVIAPFDHEQAVAAARLRAPTRYRDGSQADRACLALAQVRGLPVLTGDRDWAALDLGIATRLFR